MIVFSKKKKSGRFECRILEKTDPHMSHVIMLTTTRKKKRKKKRTRN